MSLSAELTKLGELLHEASVALDRAIEECFPPEERRNGNPRVREMRALATRCRTEALRLKSMAKCGQKVQARGTEAEA
jgi:hypothetical protein